MRQLPLRIVVLTLATLLLAAFALAQVPADRTAYELPGDGVFPEGIAYHEGSNSAFVSGAGSGGIYRIDLASGEVSEFLPAGTRAGFTTIGLTTDDQGRLWVAGGGSGSVLVYDIASGDEIAVLQTPEVEATFINDVVVAPNGDVFATDSSRPVLFRVPAGTLDIEAWLDFDGTVFEYQPGFNANGVEVSADGSYLLVVSALTGALYRVDVESREVIEIAVEGGPFPGGDGLVLDGQTLYIVQNSANAIPVVSLSDDFSSGSLERVIEDASFMTNTTAALVGDQLLVVNAQFGAMGGTPSLPFSVSVVPAR